MTLFDYFVEIKVMWKTRWCWWTSKQGDTGALDLSPLNRSWTNFEYCAHGLDRVVPFLGRPLGGGSKTCNVRVRSASLASIEWILFLAKTSGLKTIWSCLRRILWIVFATSTSIQSKIRRCAQRPDKTLIIRTSLNSDNIHNILVCSPKFSFQRLSARELNPKNWFRLEARRPCWGSDSSWSINNYY